MEKYLPRIWGTLAASVFMQLWSWYLLCLTNMPGSWQNLGQPCQPDPAHVILLQGPCKCGEHQTRHWLRGPHTASQAPLRRINGHVFWKGIRANWQNPGRVACYTIARQVEYLSETNVLDCYSGESDLWWLKVRLFTRQVKPKCIERKLRTKMKNWESSFTLISTHFSFPLLW